MVSYDYQVAKTTLNEAEKDRILCIYVNTDAGTVDWSKATADYGSASVESFKKTTANMLKKLDAATKKASDDGTTPAAPATPASTKGGAKKRKAKGEVSADGDDGEGAVVTPKAKRGRPKKTSAPKAVKEETADEGEGEVVAEEAVGEEFQFTS